MADVAPKEKTTADDKIAQYLCMIGSIGGERRTGFEFTERDMKIAGRNWSDVGNAYRYYFKHGPGGPGGDADKYSEAEMQELAQAARAQGVEQGIKINRAQAQANGNGSGITGNGNSYVLGMTLPWAREMAEYCHHHKQLNRMKDNERQFIKEMRAKTLSGVQLKRGPLGYLASLYIKYDGKI